MLHDSDPDFVTELKMYVPLSDEYEASRRTISEADDGRALLVCANGGLCGLLCL